MTLAVSRHGHACVRIERDGRALVVDPGVWSDLAVLDAAEVVLVTHEHPDHLDVDALAARAAGGLVVHAPQPVLDLLEAAGAPAGALVAVAAGDELAVAGLSVRVLGERHAVIHPDLPVPANVAYLVEDVVLHPGDSYTPPPDGADVDLLLQPLGAPWLRLGEAADYVRQVAPRRVVPIHDALLSDLGRGGAVRLLRTLVAAEVLTPEPGEPVLVPLA